LAKAVVAFMVTFGLPVSEQWQTFILAVITIVGAAVVERPQVTAKTSALVVEGSWTEPPQRQ
jgi:hypothetical protein